jgi:uncharacterized membrane protein YsdA (DUF1294 family)
VRAYTRSPMSATMRTVGYTLSGILLALTATLILEGVFSLQLIVGWLISINLFTAIFYWIDKINSVWVDENRGAQSLNMRIPEWSLLALALAGGSLAAGVMITFLPHKRNKDWFMLRFVAIFLVQIAFIIYLLWDYLP